MLPALAGKCKTGGRLNLRSALRPSPTQTPTPVELTMVRDQTAGLLRARVTGRAGQAFVLEQSVDLKNWSPATTLTLPTNGFADVSIDLTSGPRSYYRARSL